MLKKSDKFILIMGVFLSVLFSILIIITLYGSYDQGIELIFPTQEIEISREFLQDSRQEEFMNLHEDYFRSQIPEEYFDVIYTYCIDNGIPVSVPSKIIEHESRWNENAIGYNDNGSFDIGLFQLNNRYTDWYASRWYSGNESFDPINPEHNIEVSLQYLSWIHDRTSSNWRHTIMCWNIGLTAFNNDVNLAVATNYYNRVVN